MWGYVFGPASGTNGTYSELGIYFILFHFILIYFTII